MSKRGHRVGEWVLLHEDYTPKARGSYRRGHRVGDWSEWDAGGQRRDLFYYGTVIVCVHKDSSLVSPDRLFVGVDHSRGAEVKLAEPGGMAFFKEVPTGRLDIRVSTDSYVSKFRADMNHRAVNIFVLVDDPGIEASSNVSKCPSFANKRGEDAALHAVKVVDPG